MDMSTLCPRALPREVISRALSAGKAGKDWLRGLDGMISELESEWRISVGGAMSGGSHSFCAPADGIDGGLYVLKLDMPEDLGGEFDSAVNALRIAGGNGYAKLYRYDARRRACLTERLGTPLSELGYGIDEQLRLICGVLKETWKIPVSGEGLTPGGTDWFAGFIKKAWSDSGRPCSERVIDRAYSFLDSREADTYPPGYVLAHGDAHAANLLRTLSGDGFKFVDPDGLFYEKAYDLGVLMREWIDDYSEDPISRRDRRCAYLSELTGVNERAISEWGDIQTVSTALVLMLTGREEFGRTMLAVAEVWAGQ